MDDEYVGIHHAPGYASKEREGPEQLHQRQKKSEAVVTAKELAGACEGCHEDGETVGDGPRTWIS
jgi:hypothetical protein